MSVQLIIDHLKSLPNLANLNVASLLSEATRFIQKFPEVSHEDRKVSIFKAFEKIAAGADGVIGTADDIFPPETVQNIKVLLDNQIMDGFIDVLSNGTFEKATASCFACFGKK